MTMPDWFTSAQRAAGERGAARALADCAKAGIATTTDVTLDAGYGRRTHITWCLTCQAPATRCSCGNIETLIEDPIDAEADIATLIAESREQLQLHADAVIGIEDITVAGGRL